MHTAKVHLLQSVVSRLLVELVFGAYFVGLSAEQTRQFSQMEAFLSSIGESRSPFLNPLINNARTKPWPNRQPIARFPSPFSMSQEAA